ncbi:hypothetical protein ANCCAN_10064, partial [Ancylostoma caninum]
NSNKSHSREKLPPINRSHDAVVKDKKGGSGTNALSHSHTNKMLKTKTGPLPMTPALQRQVKPSKPVPKMQGKKPSSAEKFSWKAKQDS